MHPEGRIPERAARPSAARALQPCGSESDGSGRVQSAQRPGGAAAHASWSGCAHTERVRLPPNVSSVHFLAEVSRHAVESAAATAPAVRVVDGSSSVTRHIGQEQ